MAIGLFIIFIVPYTPQNFVDRDRISTCMTNVETSVLPLDNMGKPMAGFETASPRCSLAQLKQLEQQ